MEESLIYDLLSHKLYEYRQKLEKEENNFSEWIKKSREDLEKSLTSEQLKLVDSYKHNLILREEDIMIREEMKLLNMGIKIGMQLQKAFDEERD